MKRISFFIDGFNLYHAIDGIAHHPKRPEPHFQAYKWLDLSSLCQAFTKRDQKLETIFYFTSYTPWDVDKQKRHQLYVRALELKKIVPIFGEFRLADRKCRASCKEVFKAFEEKQTDVNISIKLFQEAVRDRFDDAVIVSGDSDLIPAIKAIKQEFPHKTVTIVIPPRKQAEQLKSVAHSHSMIKEHHLKNNQFPDEIDLGSGIKLQRPDKWKYPTVITAKP